jgi:hypothetical protein
LTVESPPARSCDREQDAGTEGDTEEDGPGWTKECEQVPGNRRPDLDGCDRAERVQRRGHRTPGPSHLMGYCANTIGNPADARSAE